MPAFYREHRRRGRPGVATRMALWLEPMATRLNVVLFTDRVGSSAKAVDIGDANRARVNQSQESITREVAAETRGLVIKFLGDGHLLTFDSASDALRAGFRIQDTDRRAQHERRRDALVPSSHRPRRRLCLIFLGRAVG